MNTEVELGPNGEAKMASESEGSIPLYEIKDYRIPNSFDFAFSMCLANTSLLIAYPILTLAFALLGLFAKLANFPNAVVVFLCVFASALLLISLIMDLLLPLITKKNLAKLGKMDLRFYLGVMEVVSHVETEGKPIGAIKAPIVYSSVLKWKRTSSCLFLIYPYNGKKGTLGIELSQMPDGLLEFLLKQKK